MVLCLGEPPGGFYDVGCCSSFITVFVMLVVVVFTFPGYFSMPPALHPGFSGPWRPPSALSSTLATFDCITFPSHFYRECHGFEWAFFIHRSFLPYAPSRHSRLPWEPAVLPWRLQGLPLRFETHTRPICLFESNSVQQKVSVGRFYLRVTTGRLMKKLPLTGFELFSR